MIVLGTETLTLPDGTEVDVQIGLSLGVTAVRPPSPAPDVTPPYIVSGTVGPDPTTFTLVFSEPVTWPGSDPRGFVIDVGDGYGIGTITGVAVDWIFTYVSGKGTNTIVLSGDGAVTHGIAVNGHYATGSTPGDVDTPGNVTDAAGNALTPFGPVSFTNNVP